MDEKEYVDGLVEEYRSYLAETNGDKIETFEEILISEADWTPVAAVHLVQLAQGYGSFMLRNALAISLALEIEDGSLGF